MAHDFSTKIWDTVHVGTMADQWPKYTIMTHKNAKKCTRYLFFVYSSFKAQHLMNLSYFRISKDHAHFEKKYIDDQIYQSFI